MIIMYEGEKQGNKHLSIFEYGYIPNELSHSKQLIDFIFKLILKLYP